ncbi:NGG1 interacting factor [Entophlyctis sp. JEL0112]|nr:NGG1 interacting factor [Entophlyctis sp. JEL0112]
MYFRSLWLESIIQKNIWQVGLLLESPVPRAKASRVFLTIDLTTDTLNEALSDEAVGVIVSYHPPLFSSFKRLTLANTKQRIALQCAAAGVSILSPHTCLDNCGDGINDWLAQCLLTPADSVTVKVSAISELDRPRAAAIASFKEHARTAGIGRWAVLSKAVPLAEVIANIKRNLGIAHIRVALPSGATKESHLVTTVAICAGSGGSVVSKAAVPASLVFTGEMGHHDVLGLVAGGSAVVLCEHSNTERGYLEGVLKPKLEVLLRRDGGDTAVDVVCSKVDADPLTVA